MENSSTQNIISYKELCRRISRKLNVREGDVELFLETLIKIFVRQILTDKYFRIRGLGSFKIITVAPRESVDISTGEKITIESFNKIHYVPDKDLKRMVVSSENASGDVSDSMENVESAPIVDEDTEELSLEKFDNQAREIIEILEELGEESIDEMEDAMSQEEVDNNTEEINLSDNNNPTSIKNEALTDNVEHTDYDKNKENFNDMSYLDEEKVSVRENNLDSPNEDTEELDVDIDDEENEDDEHNAKKSHLLRDILITIAAAVLLVVLSYFFLQNRIIAFIDSFNSPTVTKVEHTEDKIISNSDSEVKTSIEVKTPIQSKDLSQDIHYDRFIRSERLYKGEWLAKLARKYYGETDLWVFIYDANKNTLSNPHFIPAGTLVRIPELPDEYKNLSDPHTKALVESMIKKYK